MKRLIYSIVLLSAIIGYSPLNAQQKKTTTTVKAVTNAPPAPANAIVFY